MNRDEMIDALRAWHNNVTGIGGELPDVIKVRKSTYDTLDMDNDGKSGWHLLFRRIKIEVSDNDFTVDGL